MADGTFVIAGKRRNDERLADAAVFFCGAKRMGITKQISSDNSVYFACLPDNTPVTFNRRDTFTGVAFHAAQLGKSTRIVARGTESRRS